MMGYRGLGRVAALLVLAWQPMSGLAAEGVETPRMRRLGTAEGLPSRMVLALGQDRSGYLWAATDDGLARYDGTGFKVWQHDPGGHSSLPSNAIETLLVDPQDRIWIGSNGGGLSMLDASRSGFRRYPQLAAQCPEEVWALGYSEQALWVGTSGAGICRLAENGEVTRYRARAGDPLSLPDDTVYAMSVDRTGRLWVGTTAGLARWDSTLGGFVRIAPALLGDKNILRLSFDRDGTLWVGAAEGLYRVGLDDVAQRADWEAPQAARGAVVLQDQRAGGYWVGSGDGLYRGDASTVSLLEGDRGSGFLTARSGVLDLLQDHEGGVWMAMLTQGLVYLRPEWKRFSTYYLLDGKPLESLYLLNAAVDGDGFLVAGAHGVYRLDGQGVLSQVAGEAELGKGSIWSVLRHADGSIWMGRAGALGIYRPQSRQFRAIDLGVGDDPQLRADLLRQAPDGSVWLSIINHGVQHRAADGRLIADFPWGGTAGLPDKLVEQLRIDTDGNLWVVGDAGVWRYDGGRFEQVPGVSGMVYDIAFADDGSLWLARNGTLEHYRQRDGQLVLLKQLGAAQGVPAVAMGGLLLGREGQVWATTPRGLLLWQPATGVLRLVGENAGLPDTEFTLRPPAQGLGRALAVSATGLVSFDPDTPDRELPASNLQIDSVQVRRDDGGQEQAVAFADVIRLGPGDRDLRVTARLLSYADPLRHRYRFRLHGYDQNWVEQGHEGERMLSRLPAGSYTLEIQGTTGAGEWSPPQRLRIEVAPAWWRTGWAIAGYVGFALLIATLGVVGYRGRLRRRNEWQLARQKHELAEQASEAKTRFLATLGHEVRTPMTGVLGMSELLLDTPLDATQRRYAGSIQQAGAHLLRLVNDALDLARIESGRLELESRPFNLSRLLDEVDTLLRPLAERKGLAFVRQVPLGAAVMVHGDEMRLRQILLNLLGNAIKFTAQGQVGLGLELLPDGAGIRLEVSDTGPGINAAQQARLFERFEQADGPRTASRYGGSGLGLAICQELAVAMGGTIHIDSRLGAGARLLVELPLQWTLSGADSEVADTAAGMDEGRGLQILLVEDDPTVAEVITGLLQARGHHVAHAAHGLAALAEVAAQRFDVGLLDLDLPALDGLALAMQLRGLGYDFPLVAVTARSDAGAEQQVREAGFRGFLRKPVTGEMLARTIAAVLRSGGTAAVPLETPAAHAREILAQ